MGIQGLWPVLEPTAEPVTLESLEGKRFAIDISIWLYQALHGYAAHQQDIKSPHLALIINRLSKLLFYKIKPVFVFDGPNVPQFKRKILREREMKRYMDDMKISKAQKRVLTEMALSNEVDSEHSQDKWINAFSSSSASSSKRKTEEDKLMEKIQLDNAKSEQNTLKLKHEAQNDSDDVQFMYSSQPTCSKSEDVKNDDLDDESMKTLITPDQRLDYLLTLRERERRGRVTEDEVPEDSREFCNFQLKRLLKRNRINEQLDMLKKEALGDMFNSETKSKDAANSQNTVLLSVMEGLTRGHFLTRDVDADVMVDEEQTEKAQQIKESISWPVMLERMRSETNLNGGGVKIERSESVEIDNRNPSPPKDSIKDENTDEDEDEALQEAIAMSIRETSMKGSSKRAECSYGDESKSDVVERFSNVFARRARDLQRDTWSDSAKSSSDESDEFIDVDDPVMPIADADTKTDSETTTTTDQQISAPRSTAASADDPVTKESSPSNEDWMPDYVHEFGRKEGKEYESRVVRTDEDIEREEEGVYKECQELLRLCGIPFVISPAEAEAQCCELERLGLVQGIVSDDSDVWLFGASTVYKNLFNQKRRVHRFSSETIREQLGLTRWEMIEIALLSGGDYTSGFENVGVVTALELISEFMTRSETEAADGETEAFELLQRISNWLNRTDKNGEIEQKSSSTNGKSQKDESKSSKRKSDGNDNGGTFEVARRRKLRETIERNNEKEIIEAFPSRQIFEAYSKPVVDSSTEKPIWSTVNENDLEGFVWQYLGWDRARLEKQTQGALQKWNEYMGRGVGGKGVAYQTHITSFAHRLQKSEDDQRLKPTARVAKALQRLAHAKNIPMNPSMSLICAATLEDLDESHSSSNTSSNNSKLLAGSPQLTTFPDMHGNEVNAEKLQQVEVSKNTRKRGNLKERVGPKSKTIRKNPKNPKKPPKKAAKTKNITKVNDELHLSEQSSDDNDDDGNVDAK